MDLDYDYTDTESETDAAMAENQKLVDQDDLAHAVEKGSRCDTKDLYRLARPEDPTKFYWADEMPKDFGNVEKGKTKKAREAFAVNILHKFDDDLDEWVVHEVRVNSAKVQKALEVVLEGYPKLTQHELKSFSSPYLPLIHRWNDLLAYIDGCEADSDILEHLQLFRKVLEPLLEESFGKVEAIEKTRHVAFVDLPIAYIPGATVFEHATRAAGIYRSCRYTRPCDAPPRYEISVDVVEWDGRRCGLCPKTWKVNEYRGLRALTALEVSPLIGLPDEATTRGSLIERGHIISLPIRTSTRSALTNGW
jgi:hypothetical protein